MAWLSQHGIAFEERDITQNEGWLDELMAMGASATPTTVIEWDQQRTVIVGFDQAKLASLLLDDTMPNQER